MTDQGPPKRSGAERETLVGMLQYLRESVVRKADGVSDEVARTPRVASGTSLMWILKHLTMAETVWFQISFAGRDVELPSDAVTDTDTLASAIDVYRRTCAESESITEVASLDDFCARTRRDDIVVDLRWVLVHMIEETARHAGHADILRELTDGAIGR